MKTYYIFRHGETFVTKQGGWYWHKLYSAPILEEGKPVIEKMANYLKNIPSDYNVSSPFLRCMQTAQIVSKITGKKFATDRRIREWDFEIPYYFKKRVLSFIQEMEASDRKVIVVCSHAFVIQAMIQFLTVGKVSLREFLAAPLPGVLTIIKEKQVETVDFNK